MISRLIELSVRNRLIVLLLVGAVSLWGVYCLYRTPIDAIPDLSENQVIVWADWPGRSPREIEDQITYPLSVNLQGLAGVKAIRATSELGFSMVNIIFDEHIGFYFARERVLERLSIAGSFLPQGVVPYLAPDATALGQIFWYTVEGGGRSLDELRAIQDWYVRYQLNSVAGVAQVASAGGFVREYQVDVDPGKLRAYDVSLGQVFQAVMGSNSSVGGKVIHRGGAEYLVRGYGWIAGVDDIRSVVVTERKGVPIRVGDLAAVQLGPAFRRSLLEKGGGEAVGGVVMMRYGENPLDVTERIKAKIQELQAGLPEGVRIVPFYDRTGLIHASIETLTGTLIEEIAVASLVVFLVLWHVRSAIVICATLPLAVLISFICMYYFGIASNIMSLSGIAISIGVLVDAGIVMTENAYNRLHERATRDRGAGAKVTGDTREVVIEACKVVGGPLFFSIVITVLSFAPVFVLGGLEGKMFNPLAYTKTFALVGVAVLAITLVPALIPTFVRGRLRSQQEVWLVRSFVDIYKPLLLFFLRHPDVIVVITGLILLLGLPVFPRKVPWIFFVAGAPFLVGFSAAFAARHKVACFAILFCGAFLGFRLLRPLGEEFMPPLDELSLMDMPITSPNANISQAGDDIRERDEILRRFPEVHQVVGKVGRADTPTDPAPVDMVETIVTLRPRSWWPKRKVRYEDALAEAERVRAELERLGVLRARESRLADLRALLAGAAESLGALSGHEGRLSGGELAPADVLEDALAAWRALAGAGHVEASELAKHESSLEGATLVYAAVLSTRPPSAPSPRADAYRGALRVLRGDVTTALEKVLRDEDADFANTVTMDAVARIDGAMRELSLRRLRELIPEKGKLLARLLRREVAAFLRSKGALGEEPDEACWTALEAELSAAHAAAFDEWILLEDVTRAVGSVVDFLVSHGKVERRADLLVEPPARLSRALDALLGLAGKRQRTLFDRTRDALEAENGRLVEERVKRIGWELQDFAPGALVWALIEEAVAKAPDAGLSGRKAASEELQAVRAALEPALARSLFLWRKEKKDIQQEMDSELQVPGWGNIWTQPIVNRVDMLSTGVRTMIGVKVFGPDLEGVQKVSNDIAAVLKQVRGAVDVLPDQVVGENYLEIAIDRERAARYGVSVQDIQDTIEVALGGKEITMTVEGRARFPVRVRYPRDHREDEESVRSILVPAGRASGRDRMEGGRGARSSGPMAQDGMDGSAAMPAAPIAAASEAGGGRRAPRLRQVPLSLVAAVRTVPGPSMIKSENGLLRSYVQLNVRDRDIVGFVEEAKRAVEAQLAREELRAGYYVEWSGQFEHQVHAQRTLTVVMPLVILIIFVILFMTYKDLADTFMMFLAVPGAVAGGALAQYLAQTLAGSGYDFSVAVWVGYIACFGLATETGIVMLVYLREALEKRGGLGKIGSIDEIKEAVIEGAVHRLRPKLLTEGTTVLALIPMLWATGVGAEFMKPMAVPILGGILVADEVVDIFIPVLFYLERVRRWRRLRGEAAGAEAAAGA